MYLLGYDVGTSSVKASLVEAESGRCIFSAFYPETEAPIIAPRSGWAEQDPEMWWVNLKQATRKLLSSSSVSPSDIKAIGISYQMHGLVCIDSQGRVLRPSIIWCDGRAVHIGDCAFDSIGRERCLSRLLNSPGNFTASKLAWVKENEPDVFARIAHIMLPGDYIAMRMSGETSTTVSGLSEGIFWDFSDACISRDVMDYYGFSEAIIPSIVPTFGIQARVNSEAASELGLSAGTPISYRAGDQPNNALSLNVMRPGEIAATGGTSGVVYGVSDKVTYDPQSRVNTFAHVNYTPTDPRLGILLCINGTGILNAWMKRNVAPAGCSYDDINRIAASAPVGCRGLCVIPFGNGAERIACGRTVGCSAEGLDFNLHTRADLLRASQEGIVYSFRYGIEIMEAMGLHIDNIHAGHANMFLSPLFSSALATVTGAVIRLYDTDGALGAARGAGIGAGIYADADEAFSSLHCIATVEPDASSRQAYDEAYALWRSRFTQKLKEAGCHQ